MPTPIIPTVGRKVWYYSHGNQAEPIDATVIKVHDDEGDGTVPVGKTPNSPVNLLAIDPDTGALHFRPRITHHADDEGWQGERFAWMPYQTAQAAKAEPPTLTDQATAEGASAP